MKNIFHVVEKNIYFNKPIDQYILEILFINYNKFTLTSKNKSILYDTTERYNYMGANLQAGDSYGICFILPFILLHNICVNFYNFNFIHDSTFNINIRYPSFKHMFLHDDIYTIIYISFSKLYEKTKYTFIDNWQRNTMNWVNQEYNILFEKELLKYNTHYIKKLLSLYIKYLLQPYYQDNIKTMIEKFKAIEE